MLVFSGFDDPGNRTSKRDRAVAPSVMTFMRPRCSSHLRSGKKGRASQGGSGKPRSGEGGSRALHFDDSGLGRRRPGPSWRSWSGRRRDGDRDAFGALVEQFQPTVYAIALRRLGNPSDALELTQEVFLHVLERITQLREPERFAGWLRQVAVRMAINRATRRVAPPSVESGILEGALMQGDEPLDQLIDRERAERVWAALGRLKSHGSRGARRLLHPRPLA